MTEREACEAYISSRYPLAGTSDADDSFEAALLRCWHAACAWQREQDAKVCEAIEDVAWDAWQFLADPTEQGRSIGATECAAAIRAQGER